jgi:chitodextrinase
MWKAASTWVHRRSGLVLATAALASLAVLSPAAAEENRQSRPPAGVTLVAVSPTSASLSWKAPKRNRRVGQVAGYGLYLNGTRVATTNELRYTFGGLNCGTTYALGVDSYVASGRRSDVVTLTASTASCAPAPRDTSPPSPPSGVTQTAATANAISLAWNASADDVGVAGYGAYQAVARVGTTAKTGYTFVNLACGSTYTLGVDSFDAAGNRSTIVSARASTAACQSASASPPPPSPPPPPPPSPPPSPPPTSPTYTIPASIAADCSKDVTAELQSWINSVANGSTLVFGTGACYRLEGTLLMQGRSGLTFDGKGSTLRASTVGDGHRSNLRFKDGGGHAVRGFTIEGGYTKAGTHDTSLQWSHGIDSVGAQGLVVENVTIRNVGGDCVYLGLGSQRTVDAVVRNVTCQGTGRNGVSFVAANRSRVEGGSYSAIGFIAFDVEPNDIVGFGVDGATVDGPTVGSYYLDVAMVIGSAPISNITFSNIKVTAAKGARFRVLTPTTMRRTNIAFIGNTANSTRSGDAIYVERTDNVATTGNMLPTTGVLLRCGSVTGLTFSGNTPNTTGGC